jgi:cold shock CspA family protein
MNNKRERERKKKKWKNVQNGKGLIMNKFQRKDVQLLDETLL